MTADGYRVSLGGNVLKLHGGGGAQFCEYASIELYTLKGMGIVCE